MRRGRTGAKATPARRSEPPEIAGLFAVPPRDFVRERNAIAARLRAAGRAAEAAEVQRRAKPSIALWAVNQAARRDAPAVAELLASIDRLGRGTSDPGEVRAAIAGERRAIDALQRAASAALIAAQIRGSTDVVRRVATTIRGAAADRAGRDELREGRLTREWEAPGFEVLTGATRPALRVLPGGRDRERAEPEPGARPALQRARGRGARRATAQAARAANGARRAPKVKGRKRAPSGR